MTVKKTEKSAAKAIMSLRKKKFKQGQPFMINSDLLDSDQCFLEFPDGLIKIAEAGTKEKDFNIVYEYDLTSSKELRRKLKLI